MTQRTYDTQASPAQDPVYVGGLRERCLSYVEVLAQSVSVIAPSTVPAAVLGLVFVKAGNGTWLSFVLGMLGLVVVSININQFARRSASPGSLYSYIVQGLGPTAGVLGGWALLFGYMLTGMSTLCGFALVANALLAPLGFQLPIPALFGIGAITACYIAFRDIQLSAKTMLALEGLALGLVVLLGLIIWQSKGFALDRAQLSLEGVTPSGTLGAIVMVVFAFSGFESSTSLGDEAKDPLKSIPRSVLQSVALTGLFFTVMAYVVVLGFSGGTQSLAHSETPLNDLAKNLGWGGLGTLLNIGVLLSFFSCTLAAINSTARILFAMARHGLVADALGQAHVENRTPHIAVALTALITFGAPATAYAAGVSAFSAQGYFGTLCSFGFIVVYVLISVSAASYLGALGELSWRALACSIAGVGFMLLPLVGTIGIPGSTMLPPPDANGLILIAIFTTYIAVALGFLLLQRARHPKMIVQLQHAVASVHAHFAQIRERTETDSQIDNAYVFKSE